MQILRKPLQKYTVGTLIRLCSVRRYFFQARLGKWTIALKARCSKISIVYRDIRSGFIIQMIDNLFSPCGSHLRILYTFSILLSLFIYEPPSYSYFGHFVHTHERDTKSDTTELLQVKPFSLVRVKYRTFARATKKISHQRELSLSCHAPMVWIEPFQLHFLVLNVRKPSGV